MSLISKLDYAEKSNVVEVVNRPTQATAEDFNEIKTVVNSLVDGINQIKANEVALVQGINHVLFLAAYSVGVPYCIIVHNCYNSSGYLVGHTITNKTVSGFDVTVGEAVNFIYLSVPQR